MPRRFKVSEALSILGPLRKQPKTWGARPELEISLIYEFSLCYFDENYKKRGKTGKSMVTVK